MAELCIDTGPLSGFARAGRLDTLERICAPHTVVTTRAVRSELQNGLVKRPELAGVLNAAWIAVVAVDDLPTLQALVPFTRALGAGARHLGECSVLAYCKVSGAIAIIDDADARQVGKRASVTVHGSLALVAEGVRVGILTEASSSALVGDLVAVGHHLPCTTETWPAWARNHNLM